MGSLQRVAKPREEIIEISNKTKCPRHDSNMRHMD